MKMLNGFALGIAALGLLGMAAAAQRQMAEGSRKAMAVANPAAFTPAAVTFFSKAQVDEGFSKGAVLFDGSGGRNYMVHTSRREATGMVEVHEKDTDILYVMKGGATIVTGGAMVGGKPIAADEIRGTDITGGETRKLVVGDAMIVPNGIPHWFKEVQAPFLYYVVKVR